MKLETVSLLDAAQLTYKVRTVRPGGGQLRSWGMKRDLQRRVWSGAGWHIWRGVWLDDFR